MASSASSRAVRAFSFRRGAVSGRRRFGAVRKLPSGRWQVRFRDPETERYRTAAQTFATKTEAGRWLSVLEADMTREVTGTTLSAATSRSERSPSAGTQPSCISVRRPSTSTGRCSTATSCRPLPTSRSVRSRRSRCRCGSPTAARIRAWVPTASPRPTRCCEPSWSPHLTPSSS